MNELQQTRTLTVIAAEINALTASMLGGVIEIGRRMCEAKQMIPYGTFGDWIKENTGYSSSTANNFMRLYKEYGEAQSSLFGTAAECQTIGKLSYTKALALLSLPENEREDFAKEVDAEHISTRELEQAIRERDEARKALEQEREAGEGAAMQIADLQSDLMLEKNSNQHAAEVIASMKGEKETLLQKLIETEKRIQELKEKPVEVAVQTVDASEEQIKKARDEAIAEAEKEKKKLMHELTNAKKEAANALARLNEEKEKAKKQLAEAEKKAESDTALDAEKYRKEAEDLRKQLAMSGEAVTVFKLHFSAWQKEFNELGQAIEKVDAETAEKLKAATKAQVQAWTEKLS